MPVRNAAKKAKETYDRRRSLLEKAAELDKLGNQGVFRLPLIAARLCIAHTGEAGAG